KAYSPIGLGKLLLNEFMESLKSNDYSGCYLWTSRELEAAMSIYKRHGFKLALEREAHTFGMPLIEQRYELIF
ncbi:MAG: GNAT family N-acetyltransferase, partial [Bacteroidota bacterium]